MPPCAESSESRSRRSYRAAMNVKVKTTAKLPTMHVLQSLGTGTMTAEGLITFIPSPRKLNSSTMKQCDVSSPKIRSTLDRPVFERSQSSFIRVADLDMETEHTSCSTVQSEEPHPNYHHPAVDPPPGVETDERERWIALNDGFGSHAPIAPLAIERLSATGIATSLNDSMWTPDSKTAKLLKKAPTSDWIKNTFAPGPIRMHDDAHAKDILVWTGNFAHNFFGSDLPAVRVAGVIDMSANCLVDLLVDSTRVKEYNKMSLGREDLVVFQDNMLQDGPFGCSVTKVIKSISKPPLISKHMVFVSVLQATELVDGSGYLVVTRAVHCPENEGSGADNVIKSEILLGVNLIRKIEGSEDRCLMINVNHIRSPMVPMMIAKRIGVSAAAGFINDIRSAC